jgi:hypothetical protein
VLDIVDERSRGFASYASTRNQGWLQSGAFYLAINDVDREAAIACRDGYHFVKSFAPEALLPKVPCYYLFEDEQDRNDVVESCGFLGIHARKIKDMDDVHKRTSLLVGSRLVYAAELFDCPMDTTRLLTILVRQLHGMGVQFMSVPSLDALSATWDKRGWSLKLDAAPLLQSKAVVLASGVLIPRLLQRFLINNPVGENDYVLKKIPVLVMKGDVSKAMLLTPKVSSGPQLVPFAIDGPIKGATVCLLRVDTEIKDPSDQSLPPSNANGSIEEHARQLLRWFPGIQSLVSPRKRNTIMAHFYVCQKLQLGAKLEKEQGDSTHVSRGHIWMPYSPYSDAPPSLFAFYPGKFTAAPIAAWRCAGDLEALMGWTNRASKVLEASEFLPVVAKQRYYDQSLYYMRMNGRRLVFTRK